MFEISPKIFFRADADISIGSGHLMRCMALAQAFQQYGAIIVFISKCQNGGLRDRIEQEGFQMIQLKHQHPSPVDIQRTITEINIYAPDKGCWVIVDGYHFDDEYHQAILANGNHLLVIDDSQQDRYPSPNILLNQNIGSEKMIIEAHAKKKYLLGTEYTLLRNEIKVNRVNKAIPVQARNILVTFGGSDQHNVTGLVLRSLNNITDIRMNVRIILGADNVHGEEISEITKKSSHFCTILESVENMGELMSWSDMAISASGSTSWEMAHIGLPFILIVTASNQIDIAKGLEEDGCAINMGWFHNILIDELSNVIEELIEDEKKRRMLSEKCKKLVDGFGRDRVVKAMLSY
jgi:UDP-2,4-diacetamido-2,4,6-trideoxy-beta-L-altropyranose hydrolase